MSDQATLFTSLALRVARGVTRVGRDQIGCGTLTFQQFQTLSAVDQAGMITLSALAAALGIELSTASRNIALLERQNLLVRYRDPDDARIVFIELSNQGLDTIKNLRRDERLAYTEVLARVPAAQRASVIDALQALADALGENEIEECCPDSTPKHPPKRARRRA